MTDRKNLMTETPRSQSSEVDYSGIKAEPGTYQWISSPDGRS